MTTTCQTHGRPTSGGAWCTREDDSCLRTVRTALRNIPAYYADLTTVRTKRTRYGDGVASVGGVGHAVPLVVADAFLPGGVGDRAETQTVQVVRQYARRMGDMLDGTGLIGVASPESMCLFLLDHLNDVARLPWADDFKTDITRVESALVRVVDRPADAWYAGVCGAELAAHDDTSCACACHTGAPTDTSGQMYDTFRELFECDVPGGCGREYDNVTCQRVLYAKPDKPHVTCRDCGTRYDVEARRQALLNEAREHNATITSIVRIVTTLAGSDVSEQRMAKKLTNWTERNKIRAVGTRVVDGRLRKLYRVGDVLDLLLRETS